MDPTVAAFNALPRKSRFPNSGVPNNWHFSVRHVPLSPPGNLLILVNPTSRCTLAKGPFPNSSSIPVSPSETPTLPPATYAPLVAHLLLEAFVKLSWMGKPWSWSTKDAEWAEAVAASLKALGVEEAELLNIRVAKGRESEIVDECWYKLLGAMVKKAAWK